MSETEWGQVKAKDLELHVGLLPGGRSPSPKPTRGDEDALAES